MTVQRSRQKGICGVCVSDRWFGLNRTRNRTSDVYFIGGEMVRSPDPNPESKTPTLNADMEQSEALSTRSFPQDPVDDITSLKTEQEEELVCTKWTN